MKYQSPKSHNLNRAVRILFLPAMAILWLIGWSLYWISSRKMRTKPRKKDNSKELQATLIMLEEEYLAAHAA